MDSDVEKPDGGAERRARLREVAGVFLRLGFTAFGGPAAHVALMEQEVVHRRKWVDRRQFLALVTAVNFIPGPNSTELAIHLGLIRAGRWGLVVAGACFIVPAVLIILPLAWLYVTYGTVPAWGGPLKGIVACVVAVIAAAMGRLAWAAVRGRFTAAVGAAAVVAGLVAQRYRVPQGELIILVLAAVAGAVRRRGAATAEKGPAGDAPPRPPSGMPAVLPLLPLLAPAALSSKLVLMFLVFLKVGATLFGSGYVLASYLQADLVERQGWMNATQLAHAIAVGQVTPGPLLTTATFAGYVLARNWGASEAGAVGGAVIATVGIFLPSFVFVALLGRIWPVVTRSPRARAAMDAMNAAVTGLILVVCVTLARATLLEWWTVAIAAVTLAVLLRWNVNATWLIAAAAAIGWAMGG